jgi:PDZ domain
MPELDLTTAAAEYAAGELTSAECATFEVSLRADPAIETEVAFWRELRQRNPGHLSEPGICPDLAAGVLRRASLERQATPAGRLRAPRWVAVATAAAACLGLGLGFAGGLTWNQAPQVAQAEISRSEIRLCEPLAYGEDGAGIMAPASKVALTSWLPLSSTEQADASKPLAMAPVVKPWIGVWTRQARLVIADAPVREAHLVVRIVEDSPGWKAGLRAGDMIVAIDQCPIDSPTCLGEHLARAAPGSSVVLDYWSAADAAFRSGTAVLAAAHE